MHPDYSKHMRTGLSALTFLILVIWAFPGFAQTEITNVRHWAAPDSTRVVFDLSAEPDYSYKITQQAITLEFVNTSLRASLLSAQTIDKPGVGRIVFTREENQTCKVEILLQEHLTTEVFTLKKFMDKPDRVVVDIIVKEPTEEKTSKEQSAPDRKKKVIVIDPGHGGEDPGAIGRKGTYEKHVVLALSREIKKAIDKMPGYRAVLTRDGDYYVSFNKRLDIARKNNASLFISVHADAARNRQARCSSVYCLSTGAASSEVAKLLANNENLSDIIGGVPNGEGNNQSDEIILNMFQTNTINLSKMFATGLIGHLGRVHCLKYPVFHEAPFRVLKLLDAPAVLLETAFISNAEEEKLLKTAQFRKTLASTVALSVADYFSGASSAVATSGGMNTADQAEPPKSTESRATIKPDDPVVTLNAMSYRVKRGDTLNKIAKRHETSLAVLLKLNHMHIRDSLPAGRIILVPAAQTQTTSAKPLKTYRVRKGDTLFSLAKSSAITVAELRRLNNMHEEDVLPAGRIIRLPQ